MFLTMEVANHLNYFSKVVMILMSLPPLQVNFF